MLGVGVESTHLPEVVLDRGRRLELFLADMKSRSGVQERINLAFMKAFKSGIFKVMRMDTDIISKKKVCRPSRLNTRWTVSRTCFGYDR